MLAKDSMDRSVSTVAALASVMLPALIGATIASPPARAGQPEGQGSYPNRPVRLIMGPAAGGPTDVVGRTLTPRLSELWGQPVVVENRPGAGNTIATARAAAATPDGHTLLLCVLSDAIAPAVYINLPYNFSSDIAGVARIGDMSNVLVVHRSLPVNSLATFIGYVKDRPGQLNYAAQGAAQAGYISMELLKRMAGINLVYVAYKESSLASVDLYAGRTQAQITNLQSHLQSIRSGKIRALAVTTRERDHRIPDVPTIAETPALKSFEVTTWFGICAPAGIPSAAAERVNADVRRVLDTPEVARRLSDQGLDVKHAPVAEFSRFLQSEAARWGAVVKQAGIKAQ